MLSLFYYSKVTMFLFQKTCMGSVLGPTKNEGNEMTRWISISRHAVKKLTAKHLASRNWVENGNRYSFD